MKNYTFQEIRDRFSQLGFTWLRFHIVGIRAKTHVPDKFQDQILIIWNNSVHAFSCTTIPGVHWLQNLMNSAGTAVVVADRQYVDAYARGLHKGNEALVQVGALQVYRDNNGNNLAECMGAPVAAGPKCRIDIHGANKSIKSVLIGAWSAGCQVLNDPQEFEEFMRLCKKSVLSRFTYTLLNEF